MLANMCVESHLRELLEQGFEVVVVKDATAAPKHPEWGYGYTAALINYAYLAHAVWTTAASAELSADFKRRATAYQRTVRCAVYPYVLWRETEAEAEAERRRIIEAMDRVATENWARGLLGQSGSFDPQFPLESFAFGAGALPVLGNAEGVIRKIRQLYEG